MPDRDVGAQHDHDPNLDRPLGQATQQFLQTYRASDEFGFRYDGNLSLVGDLNRLSNAGRRQGVWSRTFVDRLFGLGSLAEADRLLKPWEQWSKIHSRIWSRYYGDEAGDAETRYKKAEREFNDVEIPPEIREYQGDLTEEDLKSLAHREIFRLTASIRESIDLLEGVATPVSLDTIFRAQRTIDQPVSPVGGLETEIVNKPSVRRIPHEGAYYVAFDYEGEPADSASRDPATDEEWDRWDKLEVGAHIKYLVDDHQGEPRALAAGTVHGFYLLGAGDAMLLEPSVAKIGIISVNELTGFYQCPLVADIRLDSEEFTLEELALVKQPKPVELVTIKPQTGEHNRQTFNSMEEAVDAVRNALHGFLGE
ncbi:hypothetical protein A3F34_00470 [Candidatus Roizmanbacteria bacterium RIFCSPHIGHO2_12_FULL_44_10]|uniref:Uncharacterized protein n=1 Tax=Candidatus Roizmanbacteria bacterium RIFCSPHIGHO2_12_FULL_44_10 TaxID=1802054 RepID=A0A1F7I674_9BACT|nr:MAG: hypothetical protein A3F34_00470 [Candidatus Roizmanbacteria bacterium RIFCSPHIGHO2_12_FULL_44_10]